VKELFARIVLTKKQDVATFVKEYGRIVKITGRERKRKSKLLLS
jgi:hypothetical protein